VLTQLHRLLFEKLLVSKLFINLSLFMISPASSHLGAFATMRKATISLGVSVRPSVCMEQLGCHRMDFHEIQYLSTLWKSVKKIQVSLKSDKNNGYFTWRTTFIFTTFWSIIILMRNISDHLSPIFKSPKPNFLTSMTVKWNTKCKEQTWLRKDCDCHFKFKVKPSFKLL